MSKQPGHIIVAMLYSKPELVRMTVEIANTFNFDPALLCAHIDVRSKWDSGLLVPLCSHMSWELNPSQSLESLHRQTLWGLSALEGEFARSHGFQDPLSLLLEPATNLAASARIFSNLRPGIAQMFPEEADLLMRWNNHPNREMVALTLEKVPGYRELIARMPSELRTFRDADTTLLQEYSQIPDNQLE